MKIQKLALILICGLIFNTVSQAGVVIKGQDGNIENAQSALLGLQMKATVLGFAKNEYELGMAYYDGEIVQRDSKKAAEWLLKASKKNYAPAMFMFGQMLLTGDGVQKNPQLGSQMIMASAEKGNQQALSFIEEIKKAKLSGSINTQVSQNQNTNNGMCFYQDYYILSVGDEERARKENRKVENTEEYVTQPCKISVINKQNNIVEIKANFRVNNENYYAFMVTKIKDSCNDENCGMSISTQNDIEQYPLQDYDSIVQYDSKNNELASDSDERINYLNENIKPNQSYCFLSLFAHSGMRFCFNLGGSTVYQAESIMDN